VAIPYFEILDDAPDLGRFAASALTAGPWDERMQHGGPPNALAVRAAERCAAAHTGRADLVACRLAAEFVGPVPVAELATQARVVRAARSAVLVDVRVAADGRDCLAARVWLVAERDTADVSTPLPPPAGPPLERAPSFGLHFPYSDSIDWHEVSGSITTPGPGAVWARPRHELVPGEPWTSLQRVVFLGDSASGVSSALDWAHWTFLNVDLDVHLARPVAGDWLHLDAVTQVGPGGTAVARSTISDLQGPAAYGLQTLLVAAGGTRR
jgi:hypothetical protein